MKTANETWKVEEHGPIAQIDEGVLTVTGTIAMPLGKFPRRMTIASLDGGRTLVYSAVALEDAAMQRIEQLGVPTYLVVPNAHHRTDAKIWKQRYPQIKVLAPSGAREAVEEVVIVDATDGSGLADPNVQIVAVDGTENSEFAMLVSRKDGTTLVVNDIIAHVAHPDGISATVMARLFGFGVNHPQIPTFAKHKLVKDKAQVAAQFRRWAAIPDLRRIVPSHGDIIDQPKQALDALADALDS